jgi:cytochrome c-type biogenesis protein CcmH
MALARAALARQDMMAVWNETKAVLERSPGHAPALAYQALVRLAMGQGDKAEEMLLQARANDPNLVDAYVHLALVYARLGRMGEADKAIADATSRFPGQAAALQTLLADLKQQDTREDAAAVGEADPHAGLDVPGAADARGPAKGPAADAAGMAAGSQAPSSGGAANAKRSLSGVVELDPALVGQVSASGILFVFVREAGFGAGPPVAARRFAVSSFPMGFEIGEEDAMMGQTFPDTLLVEARLDADGDPTTRPPTDPKARIDDVKAGSRTVRLMLKRP